MEFKNKHNKEYHTEDGIVWNSRSSAVVAHVYCLVGNTIYLLIGKRGPKGDMPGLWNIPCGYLDWDETLQEALFREVFEESGLLIFNYTRFGNYPANSDQPFFVNGSPTQNRQNVALHFLTGIKANVLPTLTNSFAEPGEVDELKWIKVGTTISVSTINGEVPLSLSPMDIDEVNSYDFAFNQNTTVPNSYKLLGSIK